MTEQTKEREEPMTTQPNVCLIHQPSIDRRGRSPNLEPATAHGNLRVILESGDYPVFQVEKCIRKLVARLNGFEGQKDSLLWAGGDTLAAFLTGAVMYAMGAPEVNWLRFERGTNSETGERDNENGVYNRIIIPLDLIESLVQSAATDPAEPENEGV